MLGGETCEQEIKRDNCNRTFPESQPVIFDKKSPPMISKLRLQGAKYSFPRLYLGNMALGIRRIV